MSLSVDQWEQLIAAKRQEYRRVKPQPHRTRRPVVGAGATALPPVETIGQMRLKFRKSRELARAERNELIPLPMQLQPTPSSTEPQVKVLRGLGEEKPQSIGSTSIDRRVVGGCLSRSPRKAPFPLEHSKYTPPREYDLPMTLPDAMRRRTPSVLPFSRQTTRPTTKLRLVTRGCELRSPLLDGIRPNARGASLRAGLGPVDIWRIGKLIEGADATLGRCAANRKRHALPHDTEPSKLDETGTAEIPALSLTLSTSRCSPAPFLPLGTARITLGEFLAQADAEGRSTSPSS
eukprot:NODE_3035_length_1063_cov_25.772189_g2787_i0.p1 GENE.NODE_3035_length_1063_cov_25.772189_g2787_i0~~NODE_3035_length_1063_cov_25.772189_g2787_i0.p1  ORF type:complete len:291 (+),score=28.66 NODE_3035_length_1063_cov_25.772189_g2787_i0:108-980(+)